MFFKISPVRGTLRFGQKGKLERRYIGPYEILSKVRDIAYRLTLPPELSGVHNVFHVSMLKKYVLNPSHVLQYEPLGIREDTSNVEKPIRIIKTKEQELRKRTFHWVKVWLGQGILEKSQVRRSDMGIERASSQKEPPLVTRGKFVFLFGGPNNLKGGGCQTPTQD